MIPDAYLNTVLGLLPGLKKPVWCRLIGNSMAPLMCHGDALLVQPGNRNIHLGDVIVFKSSLRQCAHRVVGSISLGDRKAFLTKGDNSYNFDRTVFPEHVLGKVLHVKGANGILQLNSAMWHLLNFCLAVFSHVEAKRNKGDMPLFFHILDRLFTRMHNLSRLRYFRRQDLYRYLNLIARTVALERRQANGSR